MVKIQTARTVDSATSSPVWIRLIGPQRSDPRSGRTEPEPLHTGKLPLTLPASKNNTFRHSSYETFELEALDIHDLRAVEICKEDPLPNTGMHTTSMHKFEYSTVQYL